MNQTCGRRLALVFLCVALAACGGSEGDAVEVNQLRFGPLPIAVEQRVAGEGSPVCVPTFVAVFIERRDGSALPDDLAVTRMTLTRADGTQAWSPPLDPRRTGFLGPDRRRWRGIAEACSFNRITGERLNAFPSGSFATLTVQLSAGDLRGQLQLEVEVSSG